MRFRFVFIGLFLAISVNAAPAKDSNTIPFEFFHNEILVDCHIDNKGPYLTMINTGTDPSVIDLKLSKELGLKVGAGAEGDGGGTGLAKVFETKLNAVRLGSVSATNLQTLAAESVSMIAEKLGRPVRVILGKSFLQGRIFEIDYGNKTLRFLDSVLPSSKKGRVELRFQYGDDVVLEDVSLNDKPVRAILDTGSNGTIKITPEATKRLDLETELKAAKPSQATGYRGSYISYEGHVKSLSLGTIRIENPSATFWTPGTGHDGKPWDINIGNGIWKDFVITLDMKNGILYIERPAPGRS